MKTDSNGCSTCPIGEERYEQFRMGQKSVAHVQYDYRHTNGELFSCIKPTLEQCRSAKNEWLVNNGWEKGEILDNSATQKSEEMEEYEISVKGCRNCDDNAGLTIDAMHDIVDEFFTNGFDVKLDAIKHNYKAWCCDMKSGYKDEENDVFLFTPCGCNQLSFTARHLTGADWEQTYTA